MSKFLDSLYKSLAVEATGMIPVRAPFTKVQFYTEYDVAHRNYIYTISTKFANRVMISTEEEAETLERTISRAKLDLVEWVANFMYEDIRNAVHELIPYIIDELNTVLTYGQISDLVDKLQRIEKLTRIEV